MDIKRTTTPPVTQPDRDVTTPAGETPSGSDGLRKITRAKPEGFFRKIWNWLTGKTTLQERAVNKATQTSSYKTFRSTGPGTTSGQVELVHKAPVVKQETKPQAQQENTPLDNIEAIRPRVNKMTQTRPDKVPGIREAAHKTPPDILNSSELLAIKSYVIWADSAEEESEAELEAKAKAEAEADPEYQFLQRLEHPNIVRLRDAKVNRDKLGVEPVIRITLFTESGVANLSDLTSKRLPAKDTARMVRQMADGLIYLHGQQITHNDLKPGNVMVMPDMTAKLNDFGSAADFSDPDHRPPLGVLGTPGYRAPEIEELNRLLEHAALDELSEEPEAPNFHTLQRGDCWAAGCVLYELMTGTRYHDTGSPPPKNWQQHLERRLDAIPDSMEGWEPENIAAAKEALKGLLHPDPKQRSLEALSQFTG